MPRLRPMSLGDIFDEAFDLYKRNFLFLLLVAAVVAVPIQVLAPALAKAFPGMPSLMHLLVGGLGSMIPQQALDQLGPILSGPALFAPLYPIANTVSLAAAIVACSACYLGEPHTLRAAYRVPLRRLFPLIVTLLLYGLLLLLGLVLCYVGVILPMVLLIFTTHAFALEGQNFGKALSRSRRLVSGDGGRVFGCLILLWCVATVVGLGIRLPLMYAFDLLLNVTPGNDLFSSGIGAATAFDEQRRLVAGVSDGLSGIVLTPFAVCVLTVLYYDLRVRKEAFDITLLARSLHYPPLTQLNGYLPPVTPITAPVVTPTRGNTR